MSFSHKYNTDDVLIRACIVGLVNELNNRINFANTWDDGKTQTVRVPFFYAMSGDERFLQDYFSNWSDCAPDFIEGNTDPIPRGTIFLTGVSVIASNLTSRYVRGYYTKEVDGELKRFNSYINSIPVQLNFSAEILVDTSLDSFKVVQSAISVLYKTLVYNVNFKGFRVPIQVGFPENYNTNKLFEFSFGNNERIKTTFEIEVQAYLPIPDPSQEYFAGRNIQKTILNAGVLIPGQSAIEPIYTTFSSSVLNKSDMKILVSSYLETFGITDPADYSWSIQGASLIPTPSGKAKLDALTDTEKDLMKKTMQFLMKSPVAVPGNSIPSDQVITTAAEAQNYMNPAGDPDGVPHAPLDPPKDNDDTSEFSGNYWR
jgi:hypothetical protein